MLPLSKSGYLSVLATVENSCDYTAIYNVEVRERGRSQKQSYFQLPATTGKNTPQSTLISIIPRKLYSLHIGFTVLCTTKADYCRYSPSNTCLILRWSMKWRMRRGKGKYVPRDGPSLPWGPNFGGASERARRRGAAWRGDVTCQGSCC